MVCKVGILDRRMVCNDFVMVIAAPVFGTTGNWFEKVNKGKNNPDTQTFEALTEKFRVRNVPGLGMNKTHCLLIDHIFPIIEFVEMKDFVINFAARREIFLCAVWVKASLNNDID